MSKLAKSLSPTPSGWSSNTSFCLWTGVRCDEFNSVTSIKLASMSLIGTIPSDLNSLSSLTSLVLFSNSLSGALPSLANLSYLETVLLDSNNFSSVPDGCFQGLDNLQKLSMRNNINLAPWTIPIELIHSTRLDLIDLANTNLVGPLPEIFHRLFSLKNLRLSYNNLTGDLPMSFSGSGIQNLWLNNQKPNGFTGSINVLASMTQLTQVWLMNNKFTGQIPDFSNCTDLFDLQLRDNQLTGVVPSSLMALSSLKNVSLDNNHLQGPFPSFGKGVSFTLDEIHSFCQNAPGPCDPRVTTLLGVAGEFGYPLQLVNSWKGNNPCQNWSFVVCSEGKIITLNLANQKLKGTISPSFASLTYLRNLYLGDNNLTGSIPSSLTSLAHLQVLDVSNNNLSGDVPKFSSTLRFNSTGNVLLRLGSPSEKANTSYVMLAWLLGGALCAVVDMLFIVMVCKRKGYLSLLKTRIFKNTRIVIDHDIEDFIKRYNLSVPKRFSYADVKRFTNSFRDKLGQGGYGVVYKASLPDGRHVAVKVISECKGNGEEFINEVASITKTSHMNVVSLLGFCYEKNKRALIYEFMSNGSLDKFIYKSGFPNAICDLDWNTLFQIVIGIARGLEYLHQGCISRILHLDIKPQNILLDEDFCPKISDFGLAKICQKKESVVSMLGTRGTIGYISPEVFSRAFGAVSSKSDVYSYGMLILEMTGGKKNYDTGGSHTTEAYFPDWIFKDLEQGNSLLNSLAISEEENDMLKKITMVALWCIQTNPSDRPSMSKVIEMLQGPLHSIQYPPKPILFSPKVQSLSL
ncbi:receptor-like kinase TMK4 [Medicago truncatula]|nr:receptor-like kinase TMK4 [Medicago truncatula]